MRLFYAVEVPEALVPAVEEAQERLRARVGDAGVRWTRPEQFHFTLKFLGEQQPARVGRIVECGREAAESRASFDLSLGGIAAFPSAARPGVLWLGADKGAEALAELAAALDAQLHHIGIPRETKPQHPHLTLARIKGYDGERAATRALRDPAMPVVGEFAVREFVLVRSALRPQGSEYRVLDRFPLSAASPD